MHAIPQLDPLAYAVEKSAKSFCFLLFPGTYALFCLKNEFIWHLSRKIVQVVNVAYTMTRPERAAFSGRQASSMRMLVGLMHSHLPDLVHINEL